MAPAQALYGSIVGVVTDPSGAVVPNVQVTAKNVDTGQTKDDTTDASGRFNLQSLLPGNYSLSMKGTGFKAVERSGISVTPNTIERINQALELGQSTEQVNVSAETITLQTDKADTHTELTSKSVVNVPLGGQRSYQTLVNLTPGATPGRFANSITDNPGGPLQTNINGGNAQTNTTRVDGAESVNVWLPQYPGYIAPAETIDTVNIVTSSADADQGLAGSSAITVVTKSGTNEFHGSAFEFHNNQHLNARNFFLSPASPKPVGIYNNYGATLGGPILKNKVFFFVAFDGTKQKSSSNGSFTVPTLAQRNGDFSTFGTTIYNPATGNPDGTGRQAFAGNVIPQNSIDPIAKSLQAYYPAPNLPGVTNNYSASGGPILNRNTVDAKFNWNRNDKHTIWGKYGRMWATSGGVGAFGVAGGPGIGADPGQGETTVQVYTVGHTYAFSPNIVLDGNIAYQRQVQNVKANDFGTNYGTQLGIPGTNGPDINQSGFPSITFLTGTDYYSRLGVPEWMPLFRTDENYTHGDSVSWTKGAHSMHFGFDMVRFHLNHYQPELSLGGPRGLLDFNGQVTALNAPGAPAPNQFNAYAQFLLGYSNQVQKGLQYILMTTREWQFGWYAQDRWQVTRNLTFSYGLRYELYPLMTRCCGKGIERYDPATNNVYMGARGNIPADVGITVSHKLFAPRAGLAYRLGDKMVIRSGYGLNYDPIPFSRPLRGFYPLTINSNTQADNSFAAASTLRLGIPSFSGPDLSTGIVQLPGGATERSPWAGELHRGYVQSWNFSVERRLPLEIVTSVGYVGQHSVHLLADRDINSGYPGSGTTGLPYYSAYGSDPAYRRTVPTNMWDGYLSSSYNSLQVAVNRSFSKGLLVKGAYTWSHAIDYTDDDGWASTSWNWAPVFQRNRASAGFDRTHVFQMAWVYELPVGKGKQFVNSGIASQIIGGWQLSGVHASYTGTPFNITAPGTSLNAPNNLQTADQIAAVQFLGGVGSTGYYYAPTSFRAVNEQRFGTMGRNVIRNPGLWNTDLSISRVFPIKERMQLQFKTEFYNLPNTSHFWGPGTPSSSNNTTTSQNVTASNFMRIVGSYGERNIRFALRLQW
ncbi:MAG: carboxypeptidase regulatory-like domain-containing protein [Bryobacteraceae bacterium]